MTKEAASQAYEDEQLVDWVIAELGKAFTIERVELLGEAVKVDKANGVREFQDERELGRIREAYGKAKERLRNVNRS